MIRIDTLSKQTEPAYRRFLSAQPGGLLYYSQAYRDLLIEILGCEAEYLLALQDNQLKGILPLMKLANRHGTVLNSLPFFGSNGGVIASTDSAAKALVDKYNEMASSQSVSAATIVTNPFVRVDYSKLDHTHKDVRIAQFNPVNPEWTDGNRILQSIEASARRNVKKADAAGLRVETQTSPEGLAHLDRLHHAAMGQVNEARPKSTRFFTTLNRHFEAGKDFQVYLAKGNGEPVAGLLVFYFGETAEYFVPATAPEHRSTQPLSAILRNALQDCARRGIKRWNWGATHESQTGVYRFKKKWGAQEIRYSYFTQLNDHSILGWSAKRITENFPNFYVVPFSYLEVNSNE